MMITIYYFLSDGYIEREIKHCPNLDRLKDVWRTKEEMNKIYLKENIPFIKNMLVLIEEVVSDKKAKNADQASGPPNNNH